jgi:hypothetical protein
MQNSESVSSFIIQNSSFQSPIANHSIADGPAPPLRCSQYLSDCSREFPPGAFLGLKLLSSGFG